MKIWNSRLVDITFMSDYVCVYSSPWRFKSWMKLLATLHKTPRINCCLALLNQLWVDLNDLIKNTNSAHHVESERPRMTGSCCLFWGRVYVHLVALPLISTNMKRPTVVVKQFSNIVFTSLHFVLLSELSTCMQLHWMNKQSWCAWLFMLFRARWNPNFPIPQLFRVYKGAK